MTMRMSMTQDLQGYLFRFFMTRWSEVAYIRLGLSGLQLEIEFPSDWHEERAGWVRLGLGFMKIGVAFPWPWVSKDDGQCSGHTYGFNFFGDGLHIHWGKQHGKRDDPFTVVKMPWQWRHREHLVLSEPETHSFTYLLRDGTVQHRDATIQKESRLWARPWIPHRRYEEYIDIQFSDEVGEKSGSWKGGVLGCSYTMYPGETPLQTLRRMQVERKL